MGYLISALKHALQRGREWVTSSFGWRTLQGSRNHHNGIDLIDRDLGTDYIVAIQQGKVAERRDGIAGYTTAKPAGNFVVLKHGGGYETHYYHMRLGSVSPALGKLLATGDVLGFMGSTGWSTGPHLHFGVKKDGVWQDPAPYIRGDKEIPRYSGSDGVGKPVKRDAEKRQLKVTVAVLNWREGPSRQYASKGAATPGDYDITGAAVEADGYIWYPVADAEGLSGWLADVDGSVEVYAYREYVGAPDADESDTAIDQIYVFGALRARTEPSSGSDETIVGLINRGRYKVGKIALDAAGRRWGLVCGEYWICADTDVSEFVPAVVQLYAVTVTGCTEAQAAAIEAAAIAAGAVCEVKKI